MHGTECSFTPTNQATGAGSHGLEDKGDGASPRPGLGARGGSRNQCCTRLTYLPSTDLAIPRPTRHRPRHSPKSKPVARGAHAMHASAHPAAPRARGVARDFSMATASKSRKRWRGDAPRVGLGGVGWWCGAAGGRGGDGRAPGSSLHWRAVNGVGWTPSRLIIFAPSARRRWTRAGGVMPLWWWMRSEHRHGAGSDGSEARRAVQATRAAAPRMGGGPAMWRPGGVSTSVGSALCPASVCRLQREAHRERTHGSSRFFPPSGAKKPQKGGTSLAPQGPQTLTRRTCYIRGQNMHTSPRLSYSACGKKNKNGYVY